VEQPSQSRFTMADLAQRVAAIEQTYLLISGDDGPAVWRWRSA
jgi:hypothetical protein